MNTFAAVFLTLLTAGIDDSFDPTSSYREARIEGFRVLVNPTVDLHERETKEAMAEIEKQLMEIVRVVPRDKLVGFQKVTIWLEWSAKAGGGAEFHPSADWLKTHGYNPAKAGGIEINNVRNFLDWSRKTQPCMILHELAHAYHFRVVGENDSRIAEAFRQAGASRKYDSVEFIHGGKKKAYALANKFEYFAETTEAYFGKNDFYPFTKTELREFDPEGFRLMEAVWGAK